MNDHEPFHRLLAGRELGGLDPAEALDLDIHLASCGACVDEGRRLADVTAAIGLAVPVRRPPESMRASILAAVRAEAAIEATATTTYVTAPVRDTSSASGVWHGARSEPRPKAWGEGWERLLGWFSTPRVGLAAGALAVVLAVTSAGFGVRALDLRSQLDAERVSATAAAHRMLLQGEAMAVSLDPRHLSARLAPEEASAAEAVAEVVYRPGVQAAYLVAVDLPPTPAGHVYQLWYADRAGVHALATFTFDGAGPFIAPFGVDLGGAEAAMVTLEPEGGASGEPGPQVVFGKLRSS